MNFRKHQRIYHNFLLSLSLVCYFLYLFFIFSLSISIPLTSRFRQIHIQSRKSYSCTNESGIPDETGRNGTEDGRSTVFTKSAHHLRRPDHPHRGRAGRDHPEPAGHAVP